MYVVTRCGSRAVISSLKLFNEFLDGALGKIPSHQSVFNWLKKVGIMEFLDACEKLRGKKYAIVIDESITVGSQKLLLILGIPAKHTGDKSLSHKDAIVLGMAVSPSWNGGNIEKEIAKIKDKIGYAPEYVVSDNGRNLCKGVEESGLAHHKDISHSFGVILEKEYKDRSDFKQLTDIMDKKRLSLHLTGSAYLLPPKQRAISRFMNISTWVDWAYHLIKHFNRLSDKEKKDFSFILEYQSLVLELHAVMDCMNFVSARLKCDGLSEFWADFCSFYVKKTLIESDSVLFDGAKRVGRGIVKYIEDEKNMLASKNDCHNISSDIIESTFGVYKYIQSYNKLNGVTTLILAIPLLGKLRTENNMTKFEIKMKLEAVRMLDLQDWKKMNLLDNWTGKRVEVLKKVG